MTISATNSANNNGGFATTVAKAYGVAVTSGDSLVAWVFADNTTMTCTVGDSVNGANTWTQVGTILKDTTNAYSWWQFKFDNTAAGTPTVTATFSGSPNHSSIIIAEVSGTQGFDTNVAQLMSPGSTTADAITSGNATPTKQPGLIIGIAWNEAVYQAAGHTTPLTGTGFTSLMTGPNNGNGDSSRLEYKRYTSTAALALTETAGGTDTANNYAVLAMLFQETGASGGSPQLIRWDQLGAMGSIVTQ